MSTDRSALRPIRALPPAVADAIAAGEVVERPASVVKELCENALDAGARRIDVTVEGGGVALIRVVDDGAGIPASELRLAVSRHATSKIEDATDLAAVATLGFRGEALASVAAVAEVEITSRTATARAEHLLVRAAEVVDAGPAAGAPGTTVEVRDLFFATPARLRFMRTPRAETTACVRVVSELAVCRPEVAFSCRAEGRSALRSPGGTLRDACRAVFGASAAAEMLAVAGGGDIVAGGLISQPRSHRGTRGGVVLVVNGRRVHNRALLVAVEEAYRGLLPVGRHPFGVVTVDLDPAGVDVNVHPAKREVRFRDEGRVFTAVQRACWEALQGAAAYAGSPGSGGVGDPGGARALEMREVAGFSWGGTDVTIPGAGRRVELAGRPAAGTGAGTPPGVIGGGAAPKASPRTAEPVADLDGAPGLAALAPLRALGQAGGAWMVAHSPRGVVLVDPHAAHEKVIYVELMAARRTSRAGASTTNRSQLLLIPAVVDCEPAAAAVLEAEAETLAGLGFAIEPFGPATVRVHAVPAALAGTDPARLVHDLCDGLGGDAGPPGGRDHRLAALVACHAAVRFGDSLDVSEQQQLLDRLVLTPGGLTCPHGRPTVILLDDPGLRRAFGRPPAPR